VRRQHEADDPLDALAGELFHGGFDRRVGVLQPEQHRVPPWRELIERRFDGSPLRLGPREQR
jgi:hypothetical protein